MTYPELRLNKCPLLERTGSVVQFHRTVAADDCNLDIYSTISVQVGQNPFKGRKCPLT
jgi:hypothetical protein